MAVRDPRHVEAVYRGGTTTGYAGILLLFLSLVWGALPVEFGAVMGGIFGAAGLGLAVWAVGMESKERKYEDGDGDDG